MMIRRAPARASCLVAALGVAIVLSAAPRGAAAQRGELQPRRLTFKDKFAGVSADGISSVWEGSIDGAARGRIRVELHQVEGPTEAASPVWHVVSHWSVDDPSGARSFEAELEGMVDWRTGATRLSGVITQGWMKGAWVQEHGRFVNGDASGTLAIAPQVARP